ncbi:molybdenum cofactor synthesis domain protein [Halobacteroides halobius DSM 5150]|uniref:Molybdenum cofactor biosynthesis protein B n=1 Tax=Halobacteroides halobius (strain ATCC 35273 / DSM 5150 / MD-1) TaxID=748449 RepID=L0KAS3_HALHC|nr:MogA/MoaB family molybdenum cofactor biosynthesis protein [Halobacteroides halobius]AGB41193.1 molybdenum cofactor synthesis domain protein [Halobacteroides halobius DSM 5150]
MIKVGILTLSDTGAAGKRKDKSGKRIEELISQIGGEVTYYQVLPDDKETIVRELKKMTDQSKLELILTTGGTGLAPRDVTPEATTEVIDTEVPGIAEAIRAKSLAKTPKAMLSRAVAGVRNESLIINLPGSPKAVEECLEVVLPVLTHAVKLIKDQVKECARD